MVSLNKALLNPYFWGGGGTLGGGRLTSHEVGDPLAANLPKKKFGKFWGFSKKNVIFRRRFPSQHERLKKTWLFRLNRG